LFFLYNYITYIKYYCNYHIFTSLCRYYRWSSMPNILLIYRNFTNWKNLLFLRSFGNVDVCILYLEYGISYTLRMHFRISTKISFKFILLVVQNLIRRQVNIKYFYFSTIERL